MENLTQLQTRCVAHEIRNHVSICDMYTEIIKKHLEKSNYQNESVENAIDCIKKSLKIIGVSLLDLKIVGNLEYKNCDLKYIIEESARLSNAYTFEKNIDINCSVNKTAQICIDENKFLACVVNVIKNAIEAIEIKGIIKINADVIDDNAHIIIENNGKMIPVDKQQEIFTQGYTTKAYGCGLGLYICKSQLEMQKATLRLNKSTKASTQFEIIVPVVK